VPLTDLSDHTAEASRSRIETIRQGLAGPVVDRTIWIGAAQSRLSELERHDLLFGLEEFEREEMQAMRRLLKLEEISN
jgi:hypothetical protein